MIIVYQIIHILFALDFGFLKHKSPLARYALNCFSFFKCVVISVATTNQIYAHEGGIATSFFLTYLTQYMICASILAFLKPNTTFCNLHSELRQIDAKLKVNDSLYHLEFKILLSLFLCFAYRIIFTLCFCKFSNRCVQPYWASVVFFFIFICIEICLICYTYIFYSVNCRLEKLLFILTTTDSNFAFFQHIYKSVVDITERYKAAFDPVVSTKLKFIILI